MAFQNIFNFTGTNQTDMINLWSANFENSTVTEIVDTLQQYNITSDITDWLNDYFGPEGYITLYFFPSTPSTGGDNDNEGSGESEVPSDSGSGVNVTVTNLEIVEAWIKANLDNEVEACQERQCNATNGTSTGGLPTGSGSGQEEQSPTIPFYTRANYTLPKGCKWDDDEDNKVCCWYLLKSGCYTLDQVNNFNSQLEETCPQIGSIFNSDCEGKTLCFRSKLWSFFKNTCGYPLYIWLYFDNDNANLVFNSCSNQGAWSFNLDDFFSGLKYFFGLKK